MKKKARLNLELATQPLRNRRLFFVLIAFVSVLVVGLGLLSFDLYFDYAKKLAENRSKAETLEGQMRKFQSEESRTAAMIGAEEDRSQSRIDLVNAIILSKSFSWIEFLSDLEEALPDRCYIVSMAPLPRDDNMGMEVRVKVAGPQLSDLLLLYTRFADLGFKNVRITSEDQTASGEVLAEVSFSYERSI